MLCQPRPDPGRPILSMYITTISITQLTLEKIFLKTMRDVPAG